MPEYRVHARKGDGRSDRWGVWDEEYQTWLGAECYECFELRPDGTQETAATLARLVNEDKGLTPDE